MWKEIGVDVIFLSLLDKQSSWPQFTMFGFVNPWPKIIFGVMITSLIIVTFSWFGIYISIKQFFQSMRTIPRLVFSLAIALCIGWSLTIASVTISNIWIQGFWVRVLGLVYSAFVIYFSPRIVFPATSILIYWAIQISRKLELSKHA